MLKIPSKLSNLLSGSSDEISASVGSAIASVGPLLQRNEAPFFPDYTDHGIAHVESVLNTCELITADIAWEVFTRHDAAVLILAVLSHDLGMLINTDGFTSLVNDTTNDVPKLTTYDESWQKLWSEFKLDVRRFDGAKLISITGSPDPLGAHDLISDNLTENGRKIAGEFLRIHHHRLAHEILVYGMPSEKGRIPLFEVVPKYMRELAGLVARSHGVPIRECFEFLLDIDRTCHREYRFIHPTYLMALIRLSDYLDLDISRTPSSILSIKSLRSPISRREWWSHKAVVDCHLHADDPENLHVIIDPSALPDIATFSVIEEKIKGIQEEIDSSWAALGEVYGRHAPLNRLSLRVRRIQSDIRHPSVTKSLPFVPHRASLESARADLLKLLIEPLYGDHPGIGIRELIQNALDAVRELEFLLLLDPPDDIEQESLDGDVTVTFEKDQNGEQWLAVADRGIGMTWVTVCKYYLTAGASFRQSDAWKRRFTDDTGKAQVLRSGRFGIGVLAAFLIGDRVRVSTRHYDQPKEKGIEFEFGLDDTTIEMRWLSRSVGTTIKVRTTDSIVKRLMDQSWNAEKWDWYCLDKPKLIRRDIDGNLLTQKFKLPGVDSSLPSNVHRIDVPGLHAVDWTYRDKNPSLVCNGILIPNGSISPRLQVYESNNEEIKSHLELDTPKVSIFDPDGRLPLDLARNTMASSYPLLTSNLADDLCKNFISYALVNGPSERMLADGNFDLYSRPNYAGLRHYYYYWRPTFGWFFDTSAGFGLTDPWNISHYASGVGLLIRLKGHNSNLQISPELLESAKRQFTIFLCDSSDGTLHQFDFWHKKLLLHYQDGFHILPALKDIKLDGIRTFMTSTNFSRIKDKQPKYVSNSLNIEKTSSDYITLTTGKCNEPLLISDEIFLEILKKHHGQIESMTECHFTPSTKIPDPGRIAQLWQTVIGGPVIPHSKEERQQIISRLSADYRRHIDEWLQVGTTRRQRRTRT